MNYFLYCRKSTEAEDRQVMSIDSQRSELERAFAVRSDIRIVEILTEAKSAKAPGRPIFGEMIRRIEAGEAEGVIAWAPDRLARNSIDGGHLVYLLDRGVLKDLKFATCTFENNSQGKFMLNIMFGYSKYYSDNLSEVVKRGNRAKLERGWRPNAAPTGYRNDPATKTIVIDPERFPLVQRLFQLVADEGLSVEGATERARELWRFRTEKTRKGGGLISASTVHRILTNRFYMGEIVWGGGVYVGRHRPAVSPTLFAAVQARLRRSRVEKPRRHAFAYTGLIRCGACGRGATAEWKTNRYGTRYLYYHCSRRRSADRCPQRSIEVRELERQLHAFLQSIQLEPELERVLRNHMDRSRVDAEQTRTAIVAGLEAELEALGNQRQELTSLRLSRLIPDEEFVTERERLGQAEAQGRQALARAHETDPSLEPVQAVLRFSKYAADAFGRLAPAQKRELVKIAVSNLTLLDGILNVQAAKPFQLIAEISRHPCQLGDWDEAPTHRALSELVTELTKLSFEMQVGNAVLFESVRALIETSQVLTS